MLLCVYIDYEATAARSSVSFVKYDYSYRDWVKMWFDCVLWMSLFDSEWLVWFDKVKAKRGKVRVLIIL